VLRIGGGEPLFGIPALIPYPEWVPFKTVAAATGLVLIPVISRLTQQQFPAKPLTNAAIGERRLSGPP
jgi:high affinity choline transporter 7